MIDAFVEAFRRYRDFSGRSSRRNYWWFMLANILIIFAFNVVLRMMVAPGPSSIRIVLTILLVVYYLALIEPSIALTVRRLHDTGRSGWWILIELIPLVGVVWFLVLMCLPSEPAANRFGLKPA